MPMVAQQAEMEDILSSIRSTLAEETAKVGTGSADLIDAAAQDDVAHDGDEDVLELTAAEMLETPPAKGEELIDISAFAQTGDAKPADAIAAESDPLGEPELTPVEQPVAPVATEASAADTPATSGEAADEFDRLLAEISQEQKQQISAAEVQKQALLAEEEPLGDAIASDSGAEEPAIAEAVTTEDVVATAIPAVQQAMAAPQEYRLGMVENADGVQIALPAEVLAMALRPMVQQWLNDNLAAVVERLVKEEITKLTQN